MVSFCCYIFDRQKCPFDNTLCLNSNAVIIVISFITKCFERRFLGYFHFQIWQEVKWKGRMMHNKGAYTKFNCNCWSTAYGFHLNLYKHVYSDNREHMSRLLRTHKHSRSSEEGRNRLPYNSFLFTYGHQMPQWSYPSAGLAGDFIMQS